jgi:hypothetical protein
MLVRINLGSRMHRKFHKVTWSDFETLEKRVEELALQRKLELRDELTKELASKADLLALKAEMQAMEQRLEAKIELVRKELSGEINNVKTELDSKIDKVRIELDGKIDKFKVELSAKVENEILRLDRKFTIWFIVLFLTLILVNRDALEFLLKVLGLVK